jgi:hypothetical protein
MEMIDEEKIGPFFFFFPSCRSDGEAGALSEPERQRFILFPEIEKF